MLSNFGKVVEFNWISGNVTEFQQCNVILVM